MPISKQEDELLKYIETQQNKKDVSTDAAGPPADTNLQGDLLRSFLGRNALAGGFAGDPTITRNVASGATRGASDRLLAAVGGDSFDQERQKTLEAKAANPTVGSAAEMTGATLPLLAVPNPAGAVGTAAMGASIGAADETAKALINGETPDPKSVATGAAGGGVGGLAGHFLGNTVNDVLTKYGFAGKPLSGAALKAIEQRQVIQEASAKAMDASGTIIKSDAIKTMADNLFSDLTDRGFSKQATKKVYPSMVMLQQQVAKGQDMSLRQFNELRKSIRDSIPVGTPRTQRNMHGDILDAMGDLIKGLPDNPQNVVAGDAAAGVKAWGDMNATTIEKRKAEELAQMFYAAKINASQGGKGISEGQALQEEVRQFLTAKGSSAAKLRALYNPDEIKAFEGLVAGSGGTAFRNLQEEYLGHNLLSALPKVAIRAGAKVVEKATGGGDIATRQAGRDLLEMTGANTEGLGGGNINNPHVNLTAAGAGIASDLTDKYIQKQKEEDMLLEVERARAALGKTSGGLPKSTPVPAPTTSPVLPTQPPQFN